MASGEGSAGEFMGSLCLDYDAAHDEKLQAFDLGLGVDLGLVNPSGQLVSNLCFGHFG
jgi:hypothetical protein